MRKLVKIGEEKALEMLVDLGWPRVIADTGSRLFLCGAREYHSHGPQPSRSAGGTFNFEEGVRKVK
jgi:hypothetical protein